jgi:hypothetical protein
MADNDILSTGSKFLDELLSKPIEPGELSKFHGPETTIKTDLWRQLLEKNRKEGIVVTIDYEMKPKSENS